MDIFATDDTMLIEHMGIRVKIIDGSNTNIKITTGDDLIFADAILKSN
jgi:2-C-methyl-D-erythritol 4-phosphate cytidylyltransferase